MIALLKKFLGRISTHPYKFNEEPPEYDQLAHFKRLYLLRTEKLDLGLGFIDMETLNLNTRIRVGIIEPEKIEVAIRKMMNGIEYENSRNK